MVREFKRLKASKTPEADIAKLSYPGQSEKLKQYLPGYERFFNEMPVIEDADGPIQTATVIMSAMAIELSQNERVHVPVAPNDFERLIVGIESPEMGCTGAPGGSYVVKEGKQVIVAKWGVGFTSPIHGHAPGYLNETIIYGKIKVNLFRMVDDETVRIIKTVIAKEGTFMSAFAHQNPGTKKREAFIHSLEAVEESASLHYLPEYNRDGRGNTFNVQWFEDNYTDMGLTQITSQEALSSKIGDVLLVRSVNVPHYGDHFIVITGGLIQKPRGLRPQDTVVAAPNAAKILDQYSSPDGVVLLKLDDTAKCAFLQFHAIKLDGDNVIFPEQ